MQKEELRSNPMYGYLMLLAVAATAGLQGWRTLFNNYGVQVVGVNGFQVGLIQSLREVPGFLSLMVIYVLLLVREHKLAAASVALVGVGMGLTGLFPTLGGLLSCTFLMSLGYHYFETTNQSLTLQYFNYQQSPYVFARIRSVSAFVNILVGVVVWFISPYMSFKYIFVLVGVFVLLCAITAFFKNPIQREVLPQRKKMVLRKKYWLFYVLNFLSGARRQIFVVFAVFMLVDKYDFQVKDVTILFIVNNIIAYFFNPYIAKGIRRFGEKRVLMMEYGSLLVVFLGYAYFENRYAVALLYILDHIFFNFSIAIKTYFHRQADPRDIASSMAVGFTINHISAVIIPVIGGILWMWNWRIPFIAGAILSLVSLFFVLQMDRSKKID